MTDAELWKRDQEAVWQPTWGERRAAKACRHKRRFSSLDEARGHASWQLRTFGTVAKAYRCPVCRSWHLACRRKGGR